MSTLRGLMIGNALLAFVFASEAQGDTVIAEDFTNGPGCFSNYNADIFSVANGQLTVGTNVIRGGGGCGTQYRYALCDTVLAGDFLLDAEVAIVSAQEFRAGVVYGWQGPQKYYIFHLNDYENGVIQLIAFDIAQSPCERMVASKQFDSQRDRPYHVRVAVSGTRHTVYIDGNPEIDVTDTGYAGGQIGLAASFNGVGRFDNLRVEGALFFDDFEDGDNYGDKWSAGAWGVGPQGHVTQESGYLEVYGGSGFGAGQAGFDARSNSAFLSPGQTVEILVLRMWEDANNGDGGAGARIQVEGNGGTDWMPSNPPFANRQTVYGATINVPGDPFITVPTRVQIKLPTETPVLRVYVNGILYRTVDVSTTLPPYKLVFSSGGDNNNHFGQRIGEVSVQSGTALDRVVQKLEIVGPSQVPQRSATEYECRAYYSDGTTSVVPASWTLQPPSFCCASVSVDGVLTADDVPSDQSVRLRASYTEGSVTTVVGRDIRIGALPDLIGYSFSSSQNMEWGKKVVVRFSLRNTGAGQAAPCKVAFYLKDDAGHRFDIYNATSHVPAIAANQVSQQYDRQFILPYNPPNGLPASGALTIGMRIDPDGSVPELDETNNEGVGEGVDYMRTNISTPPRPFVNGVVFDPRESLWREHKDETVQKLKTLGVDSARFWMNWCVVMRQGVPEAWQHKIPGDVTTNDITDCASGVGDFAGWVDWSTYDDVIRTLRANGLSPVPLICDGSAAPYMAGTNYRVSPDAIGEQCSTDMLTDDCDGSDIRKGRDYKGIGEDAYLALVKLFAGAAAKRYSAVDNYVEMWNLENEPNWLPAHVLLAPQWRCGPPPPAIPMWLDREFTGRLLKTMRDAVRDGNPSARTTINWNASFPGIVVESTPKLQPFVKFLREQLGLGGVLGLWDNYLTPLGKTWPWEEGVQTWSQYADVIGLGFYPNYFHAWPIFGGAWAFTTVAEANAIARSSDNLNPKPVQVLETGYPTAPTLAARGESRSMAVA